MIDLIKSLCPAATVYLIPLIPLFIYFWMMQRKSNKTLVHFSSIETRFTACEIARNMLKAENLTIPVEKGENFLVNRYVPEEDKILLGPDTFDQKDVTALGQAVHAAGRAIAMKKSPEKISFLDTLKKLTQILFWGVFTILSFGLMGNSTVTIIIGYVFLVIMLAIFFIDLTQELKINKAIDSHLKNILPEEIHQQICQVLNAEVRKF